MRLRAVDILLGGLTVTAAFLAANELKRCKSALERERARRRDAEEANHLKDEFITTLSHELRTPLNAIVGWANLLRDGRLDPATTVRAVDTINRNVKAQTHIISDIRDMARFTSGQLRLEAQPVALGPVLEGVVESMRPSAAERKVELVPVVEPVGPVLGDADRLQQVIWNLLSNAIKFTPQGGRVEVRLTQEDSTARIAVRDDGDGIDPEFLPHVFERFRHRNSMRAQAHGGLGLGLAIVKHIVDLHGGTVSAANGNPPKGALFTVTLPIMQETSEVRP